MLAGGSVNRPGQCDTAVGQSLATLRPMATVPPAKTDPWAWDLTSTTGVVAALVAVAAIMVALRIASRGARDARALARDAAAEAARVAEQDREHSRRTTLLMWEIDQLVQLSGAVHDYAAASIGPWLEPLRKGDADEDERTRDLQVLLSALPRGRLPYLRWAMGDTAALLSAEIGYVGRLTDESYFGPAASIVQLARTEISREIRLRRTELVELPDAIEFPYGRTVYDDNSA